jgi:hypothetical protein
VETLRCAARASECGLIVRCSEKTSKSRYENRS